MKMEDNTREEVLIQIKAGCSCFGRYKDSLCDKKTTSDSEKESFQSVSIILTTMTYCCENWTATNYLEQKLTAQHALERRMLNITLPNQKQTSSRENKRDQIVMSGAGSKESL